MNELFEKRNALIEEQETLLAKESMTEADEKRYDEIDSELDKVERDIDRQEKVEARKSMYKESKVDAIKPIPENDDAGSDERAKEPNVSMGKARILDKPFEGIAEFSRCVRDVKLNGGDPRLLERAAGTGGMEKIDSYGGFLVDDTDAADLFSKMHDGGNVLSRVDQRVIPVGSNSLTLKGVDETSRADGSRQGGIQCYWDDELDQLTASRPKFYELNLKANKVTGLNYGSAELLEDAPNYEAEVARFFREEMTFKLEDAIVNGDGSGKPLGFLNAPAVVQVSKETGQSADTIVYENITKMYSRLWAPSMANAVWFYNQDVFPQLASMSIAVGTGGAPAYMPANGLAGAPYGTLMGKPIIPIEFADTVGDRGDLMLCDLSQYVWATKGGINSAMSMHLKFDYDQVAFRWTMRVDGAPRWNGALTPFKSTNTLSPFIVLQARS